MTWLARAIEAGGELVCVATLAVLMTEDAEGGDSTQESALEALTDFRQQSYGNPTWPVRVMYSDRVLKWTITRIAALCREQGSASQG